MYRKIENVKVLIILSLWAESYYFEHFAESMIYEVSDPQGIGTKTSHGLYHVVSWCGRLFFGLLRRCTVVINMPQRWAQSGDVGVSENRGP